MEFDNNRQNRKTLPPEKAHTLLVDLMHEGYDTYCSEANDDGNLTVIWPASSNCGKQLIKSVQKGSRPLTSKEKKEYNDLTNSARQMTISDFLGGN